MDLPVTKHAIRPVGFMALTKWLAMLVAPSEAVLRALPWLAGLAALGMAWPLAKRLFSSDAARLLFVAVIALHPAAIDYAKEFKPYAVGLALHMAFLLLALRYLDLGKRRDLAIVLVLALVGTLFSQDAIFVYPGLFGLLLFRTFKQRRIRHLTSIALTALATLALLVVQYACFWSKAIGQGDETTEYWGKKYDVFYVAKEQPDVSRLRWTGERLGDIAALPGMRRETWHSRHVSRRLIESLQSVDRNVWQALAALGVVALFYRRKPREGWLLLSPPTVMVLFNLFGFWPLGAFRTDLFAVVYTAALAGVAIDRQRAGPHSWDLLPAGALVVLPFLLLGNDNHATKSSAMSANSAFTAALTELLALQPAAESRATLALDNPSCKPWRYYTGYHPDKARAEQLLRSFDAVCTKGVKGMARALRNGLTTPESRAYVLLSRARSIHEVEEKLPADLVVDERAYVDKQHDQLVLRVRKDH